MTISQMLAKIGDENLRYQTLKSCFISANQTSKGPCKITFGTEIVSGVQMMTNSEQFEAWIIWIPKDKIAALREELKHPTP